MTTRRHISAVVISLAVLLNSAPPGLACGPDPITPVFVFRDSPEPPFEEYARGKLGILLPTMGRKTLFIAYRYVNGGSFTGGEQLDLIDALRGKASEDDGEDAIKIWIEARKEALPKDEALPTIYTERQYGGYDFFPNCTRSGFETATETLKDRITTYGAEDPHVRDWLAAQDIVFQNCAGGSNVPQELGPDNPDWVRKDRDYQIAAAYFYSLNFDEARDRFERIAADNNSPWRETADYLIARTLVRQASLTSDPETKRAIYEHAERHLLLIGSGGKFPGASQKLLALIDYRLRPEERVGELGRILSYRNGNENLRQDLIDYVWLMDKFEAQVMQKERERKEALKGEKEEEPFRPDPERAATIEAIARGELIELYFSPRKPSGEHDYENLIVRAVKYETPLEEVRESIEQHLGRKLTSQELSDLRDQHRQALEHRSWLLAPNRKLSKIVESEYEGNYYYRDPAGEPALELLPAFLRKDELSDWLLTFQSTDPKAYAHALTRWRETDSTAWLLAALVKAERSSPQMERLLIQAEKVPHDSAAYPTIAYHMIRLRIAGGRKIEARKLLDDVISSQFDLIPVSAQNLFKEFGSQLATNLSDFLRFGQRTPAAFYKYGRYGKISDILKIEKMFWNPEYTKKTKEEFDQDVDEDYKDLLDFEGRFVFDEKILDVFNTHFPLADLAEVAHDRALPSYLQEQVLLAVWTRAILLKNDKMARRVAAEIVIIAPLMKPVFTPYIDAQTLVEREHAALFVLLRFPTLTPFVEGRVTAFDSAEQLDYYFAESWWCRPSDTDYDIEGNERMKAVAKPRFLSPEQLETARREHAALIAIGNAKSFLGKHAIEWAKQSRNDIRIPEALYIAFEANTEYKYGCESWEGDEVIRKEAESLLRNRYPDSSWTAKLSPSEK